VRRYQQATVAQAVQMMASLGCTRPDELHPGMVMRRLTHTDTRS